MNKREVFKDLAIYSAGNYISQGLGMISGFLLRMFLEPYHMGIWQGLNIIKSYSNYTNLGVSKSAAREIAYSRGKGDVERSESLKNIGFTFSVITVSVVGIGCILFALFKRNTLDIYVFWGLIAMGVIIVAVRMESYIVTILRAKKVFFPESLGKVINAVLYIGLIYLVVKNFKLYGLYAVNTAVILCSIFILIFLSKEHFRFFLKKEELKHLIKIGIPLVLIGFMFVNLTNIDRIVVIKMLGAEKLGIYSVAIMMGNIIYNVSNMASVVLYPRFQEIYGKNDDKREVYRVMQKIIKLIWFPLIILVLCGVVFLPYLVEILIPKYIAGITSMRILLCGIFFLSLSIFYRNYLVTINKQIISLFICIGVVILNLILNIIFVKIGLSIEGVALATSMSYFIYFVALFTAASYITRKDGYTIVPINP